MYSTKRMLRASTVLAALCAAPACALDQPADTSGTDRAIAPAGPDREAALALVASQALRPDVEGFLGAFDFDAFSIAIANVSSPPILHECERTTLPVTDGTCELTICPDGISFPHNVSAGTGRIRGGLQDFTLPPRADGGYDVAFAEGPLFAGGDSLLLSFSGQLEPPIVLPAFRTVEAPLKAPVVTSARPAVISRQLPFTTTWTGVASPAGMRFAFESDEKVLITDEIFVSKYQLACTFAGPAGQGTIPAAILSRFPAVVGSYAYRVETEKTQEIDSQRLTFGLGVPAVNGSFLPVTLE
jgi:hypothetical protein